MKLYHAEPLANSLKCLIALHEKGIPFESVFLNLLKFEQHEPWFLEINPEGQVPVLEHDGARITHTSVINEYLEDIFPDQSPLRPASAVAKARMRYWNKFIDEQLMEAVSMHGWKWLVTDMARKIPDDEFDRLVDRIPLHRQRKKWQTARAGFPEAALQNAYEQVGEASMTFELALQKTAWLAGEDYTLADINLFSVGGGSLGRLFPDLVNATRTPALLAWTDRVAARPAVIAALATKP